MQDASTESFEINSLDLSQVCIEKNRPYKTRTVFISIWQERLNMAPVNSRQKNKINI